MSVDTLVRRERTDGTISVQCPRCEDQSPWVKTGKPARMTNWVEHHECNEVVVEQIANRPPKKRRKR